MTGRTYTCNASLTSRDVLDWTSTKADRISLPYRSTGDILYHADMLIVEDMPYNGDENDMDAAAAFDAECLEALGTSTVTAMLRILPYKDRLLAGIDLTVDTADGRHLERHLTGDMERETIGAILDRFFDMGAAGLSSTFRAHWSGTYTEYKRRNA